MSLAAQEIPQVDFYLPSAADTQIITGESRPAAAARILLPAGARLVVIKLGLAGALLGSPSLSVLVRIPCYPAKTFDPTDAGDPVQADIRGTVSALYNVEHVGALASLNANLSQREARLKEVENGIKEIR